MKRLIPLVAMFVLCAFSAYAQTSRGTVTGTIADTTGAVISGANVTLTNTQTGVDRSTTTNGEGVYRFDAVDSGDYTLKISATGFGEVTKTNVEVKANQISEIGATVAPAGQQVTVDVTTESGALLQTEAPVRGGNIDVRQITELPVSGRNPVALALTLPGVATNRYGFGVGTFSVNGSRGRSNNFLIDGTENNDISVAGQAFQITNPDAIQEVSVQTSNYDAEFGRAGGAVVNVITKSGTNGFHGTASYLLDSTRDDALTNTQALDTTSVAQRKGHPPAGTDQYFSGTFGGPIKRNRTFFFGTYQEERQLSSGSFSRIVPSAAGEATLRTLFPVGANPRVDLYLNAISTVRGTANLFNIALADNRPAIQFGTGFFSLPVFYKDRQMGIRIDHKISDNDQLSGRYLRDFDSLLASAAFPGFETTETDKYQNVQIAETHIFSPSLTNELRVAYNRIDLFFPVDSSNPLGLTLPVFTISQNGISDIGVQTNLPQGRVANNYLVQDTMTFLKGNHTFRFGLDVLKQRSRQFAPIVERGLLTFASGGIPTTGGTYTAFANFVDNFGGSGGGARIDFGSPRYYPFLTRQAYFFQDRWKATQNLTLTLGIRYENFGQPINTLGTSVFTGLFNIDPATLNGPYNKPNKASHDNNNFSPTIGLAYSPSFKSGFMGRLFGEQQSVIRAGYQIGYDSFFNNIASNAATSSPNVVATNVTSTVVAGVTPRGLVNVTGALPTTARPLSPLDSQTLVIQDLVNPYYQKWSLGIQRALPWDLIVDASYVGTKGTKLFINEDLNPSVPLTASTFLPGIQRITPAGFGFPTTCTVGGTVTAAQATTRFPTGSACPLSGRLDNLQGSRLIRTNGGSSSYHSAQLLVTKRFSKGFTATGAYTFSKLIDNASEVFGVASTNLPQQAAFPSILGGQAADKALSFFNRTHRGSITYVYALPWMNDQRGFVGRMLGGWEISGVTTWESGVPLTIINGQDADGVGGNLDRPIFNPLGQARTRAVPAIATATSNPCSVTVGATYYTNPDAAGACIDRSAAQFIGVLAGTGRGNLGRNTNLTRGLDNWNMNILKRVRLTENTRIEFRTEFYNIFNHPQYGQGSVSPFSPGSTGVAASVFGSTGSSGNIPGRFLHAEFADGGGRVIRYQIKFIF
jgi:outer membrane receptor protein involved in Fe transport